jgi:tRNA/rRNA methyltransferase
MADRSKAVEAEQTRGWRKERASGAWRAADNRHFTREPCLSDSRAPDPTRFILIGTSHPGNVGAAARAMKVMGFSDLVLVAPRFDDVLTQADARAMASGATDVLERARIVPTFADALDGITYACATAMTPRDFGPPTRAPRDLFAELAPGTHRVAFVFGSERFGMSNEDVYRCHVCLSIPTMAEYGSLNLAQAVQLLAYDWRQAYGGLGRLTTEVRPLADAAAIQRLLSHCQRGLSEIGYLDPQSPRKLVARLNRLMNRAVLTIEEVQILHGIARAMENIHLVESGRECPDARRIRRVNKC